MGISCTIHIAVQRHQVTYNGLGTIHTRMIIFKEGVTDPYLIKYIKSLIFSSKVNASLCIGIRDAFKIMILGVK